MDKSFFDALEQAAKNADAQRTSNADAERKASADAAARSQKYETMKAHFVSAFTACAKYLREPVIDDGDCYMTLSVPNRGPVGVSNTLWFFFETPNADDVWKHEYVIMVGTDAYQHVAQVAGGIMPVRARSNPKREINPERFKFFARTQAESATAESVLSTVQDMVKRLAPHLFQGRQN